MLSGGVNFHLSVLAIRHDQAGLSFHVEVFLRAYVNSALKHVLGARHSLRHVASAN